MTTRKTISLVLIVILLVSCSIPNQVNINLPDPIAIVSRSLLVQAEPGSTPTATPFMPLPPTPTYIPTSFPTPVPTPTPTLTPTPEIIAGLPDSPGIPYLIYKTWEDYPGPTIWPDINLPGPVGLLPQPPGQVNIMLLGSDERQNEGGFRTDTMLLVTINTVDETVNITSFPRDLYVYIPGWTVQRMNTAHARSGFPQLALTMEYNFGVRPDYFVMVNFWSFSDVIDQLGGIDVQVAVGLTDHRDDHGRYSVPAGTVHMDGETALWYVRSRYTSSDFERTQRQQEVVKAILAKMLSLDAITRAPQLFEIYRNNVTTNLTLEDITPLLPTAARLRETERIQQYFIGREHVSAWRNTQGAQVLVPYREAVVEVMRRALNSP
jgi:polyisoprenyl-teichoic acid--peptidoglycan teichoic acid transferase